MRCVTGKGEATKGCRQSFGLTVVNSSSTSSQKIESIWNNHVTYRKLQTDKQGLCLISLKDSFQFLGDLFLLCPVSPTDAENVGRTLVGNVTTLDSIAESRCIHEKRTIFHIRLAWVDIKTLLQNHDLNSSIKGLFKCTIPCHIFNQEQPFRLAFPTTSPVPKLTWVSITLTLQLWVSFSWVGLSLSLSHPLN